MSCLVVVVVVSAFHAINNHTEQWQDLVLG